MSTTPIVESIAASLLTALQTITAGATYPYTLTVSRVTKRDEPQHLHMIVYQDDPEELGDQTISKIEWKQPFVVEAYIMPDDTDATSIDTYANGIAASIRLAVMEDYTRGGLAIDTKTRPMQTLRSSDGQQTIVSVAVEVWYRTSYADPFSA